MINPQAKLLSLSQLVAQREMVAQAGHKFVLTNGCFDLLHRGHVSYLYESSRLGNVLAVAVNSDLSVKELKGEGRPVNCEKDRAYLLSALGFVDFTTIFRGPRLAAEIRALKPDIYTKAGDYTIEAIDPSERQALIEVGAKILFMPFETGYSTTKLIERRNAVDF